MIEKEYIKIVESKKIFRQVELLNQLLQQIGASAAIVNEPGEKSSADCFIELTYDKREIEKRNKRNAGAKKKFYPDFFEKDAVDMMKQGIPAEKIAKLYGMSRATFFRRLKEAKIHGDI